MKRLMMAGVAIGLAGWCFAETSITEVTAQQRYPWNGKVDISYTLENVGTENLELAVWAVDQTTGITNVARNVTGDVAYANGSHHIVWDMAADGLALVSTSVVFAVSYVEAPLYCVIDLSGGTSATSYPVSYLPDVPSGGWSDEYKTTKLVLRKVKAGTFTMGSPTDEIGRNGGEMQHQVRLTKDYWMGVFQVTQRQWELVVGTRPSYFTNGTCYVSRPVEKVSYNMICGSSASFLGIIRQKSGLTLDLPTEAQWEYACRAGTTTALNSGKNLASEYEDSEMDKVGRYWHNGGSGGYGNPSCDWSAGTAKVGSYAPNAWGLYDMHGNVWEWCLDTYGSYADRVLRGGCWGLNAYNCRSAHRDGGDPSVGNFGFGFRLVRTLPDDAIDSSQPSGRSDAVRVDLTDGTRMGGETEAIAYSTDWVDGLGKDAKAVVAVNGVTISEASGAGVVQWMPPVNGSYVLTHAVYVDGQQVGEVLTSTFEVTLFSTVITDVVARQRYPWNGKVDIFYTLENAGTENLELAVWAVDQTTGITNVARNVTGDVAYVDGAHHIVWDMTADGLALVSTNVVFAVSYLGQPLYCVIDLSGGTSATSYPVSYRSDVPSGGWSDEYKTTKLILRKVKAGTFTMGGRSTDYPGASDEGLHQVTLTQDYWMGVFQVTQRQWELVVGTRPSYFNNDACYAVRPVEQVSYSMIRGYSTGAGWPNTSAVNATSFLGIIRQKSGLALDLPTEAQWEYACRAGTTTALNSGKNLTSASQDDEMDKVGRYSWNGGASRSQSVDTSGATAKVGSYAPNAWGLYDMHGNVWEWCLDWYDPYSGDVTDPKGPSSGSSRVLRGGGWCYGAESCRSAFRKGSDPSYDSSLNGFRLVRTPTDDAVDASHPQDGSIFGGCSNPIRIDLTEGMRTAGESETITYSTGWGEGAGVDAVAEVAVGGVVISAESGSGMVEWAPTRNGTYELTHTVLTNGVAAGEPLTATFVVGLFPEAPVINPASGKTFDTALTVSMACVSKGATIHYTTDGTTPTLESPAYVRKFKIYSKTTVKAMAFYANGTASEMAVAEYAKGRCATPAITANAEFTGSRQKVVLSCETEGAEIRYTTNGQDPDAQSTMYAGPFYVTDTTTVKAYAAKPEFMNSDIATLVITKVRGIGDTMGKPDHAFATSGNKGFVRVDDATATRGESMKSGAIGNNQKTILSTTVIGPGKLTFKWKASCEQDDDYEWDHGELRVDGKLKGQINGVTGWIEVSQHVMGDGEHTVTWTYVKDDVEYVEQDCIWVSDYAWASDYTETQTTDVPVPYDWLKEKCRDIVDEYDNYEKVAKQTAYNPRFTVEQCYVAGLDPESTTNDFTSIITMEGGIPVIVWKPDLEGARSYKVWGKTALDGADNWEWPTNALHRFFKVTVEMPREAGTSPAGADGFGG